MLTAHSVDFQHRPKSPCHPFATPFKTRGKYTIIIAANQSHGIYFLGKKHSTVGPHPNHVNVAGQGASPKDGVIADLFVQAWNAAVSQVSKCSCFLDGSSYKPSGIPIPCGHFDELDRAPGKVKPAAPRSKQNTRPDDTKQ